ncbi:MAG: M50 family metallopeptidase [Planctomycetaceae bacterium]|nr:M50 family metallopeptidase [Planctomycetaceae bacterium]
MDIDEVTAWHEAGHAFAAVCLGATVESISISPDQDDGPLRSGDTVVRWEHRRVSERQLMEREVMVILAGPVAEMIHRNESFHPATVAEWAMDWQQAWEKASFEKSSPKRLAMLEQTTLQLYRVFRQDQNWAIIGAIVDHLLAYEQMEGETVHEICESVEGLLRNG